MSIAFSNNLYALAETLGERLFAPGTLPFTRRQVLVPGGGIQRFLQQFFAESSKWSVCCGVEFLSLPTFLRTIARSCGTIVPTEQELKVRIYHEVQQWIKEGTIDAALLRYIEDLPHYMSDTGTCRDTQQHARLRGLSTALAQLFSHYGTFGGEALRHWVGQAGWQQTLWKRIFSASLPRWCCADEAWLLYPPSQLPVHVFGFSYLTSAQWRQLQRHGAHMYLFSPSELYWGDLETAKQRSRVRTEIRQAEGIEAMERWFSQQHPLVANFSKIGRDMLVALGIDEIEIEERYVPPCQPGILGELQTSIFTLCPPEEKPQQPLPASVNFSFTETPSRWSEVEDLLDRIKDLLMDTHTSFTPKDILVFAPDIAEYAPYVHAIFGSKEGLPYRIPGNKKTPFAQALQALLGLIANRMATGAVEDLLRMPAYLARHPHMAEGEQHWAMWIEKAGIRWGWNGAQRQHLLGSTEASEEGSWEFGFDRWILGMVLEDRVEHVPPPIDGGIPLTDIETFAHFVQSLHHLVAALDKGMCNQPDSLHRWLRWVQELGQQYIVHEDRDLSLLNALERWIKQTEHMEEPYFYFEDVMGLVNDMLQPTSPSPWFDMQAISFASIREGEVLPNRAIFLLGMQDGAFPRNIPKNALATWHAQPPSADIDRYVFLQICMFATERLHASYLGVCPEEHVPLLPSSVLQECWQWQQTVFSIDSDQQQALQRHISLPLAAPTSGTMPYYSRIRYAALRARYSQEPRIPLFPEWQQHWPKTLSPCPRAIDIKTLTYLLRDPLLFYLVEVLGAAKPSIDDEDELCSEIALNPLTFAILTRNFSIPDAQFISATHVQEVLPKGIWAGIALERIQEQRTQFRQSLDNFKVSDEEIYEVQMHPGCIRAEKKDHLWIVPPWEIAMPSGELIEIFGTLRNVTPKGLLCFAEKTQAKWWSKWPEFLCIAGHPDLSWIEPTLLFMHKKSSVQTFPDLDPLDGMQRLLHYYAQSLEYPIPVPIDQLETVLGKHKSRTQLSPTWRVHWARAEDEIPPLSLLQDTWGTYLQKTFWELATRMDRNCLKPDP